MYAISLIVELIIATALVTQIVIWIIESLKK